MEHCNTWEIETNVSTFSSMVANGTQINTVAIWKQKY